MRHYITLDTMTVDTESGLMTLQASGNSAAPMIAMRREGAYIAISASYGPLEIALRPHVEELARLLARLQPVKGPRTTRQVGTAQAYLAIGLGEDLSLVMRPTIVADATGHLCLNLVLTPDTRAKLFEWLPVRDVPDA